MIIVRTLFVFVGHCLLGVVCCLFVCSLVHLFFVYVFLCGLLLVVCRVLFAVYCLLWIDCCLLLVECCLVFVRVWLCFFLCSVVSCLLLVLLSCIGC